MAFTPNCTECVCEVSHEEEQRHTLQKHFNLFYLLVTENKFVPNATFEDTKEGLQRCLSGIPNVYYNAVFGIPNRTYNWDDCIAEQLNYFNKAQVPFVWYVNENISQEFTDKLIQHGFQNSGVFQGVIGTLDKPIPNPEIPSDCTLELVNDEATMDEFNELVCATFGIQGTSKDMCKTVLWKATKSNPPTMFHWVGRKQGKVVSALSTLIEDDVVSFWNGATVPELRRQGMSTALRRLALQDAISRGCRVGTSYLMSEGLAFGICSKLGYTTKWRFNAFLSPAIK